MIINKNLLSHFRSRQKERVESDYTSPDRRESEARYFSDSRVLRHLNHGEKSDLRVPHFPRHFCVYRFEGSLGEKSRLSPRYYPL